MTLETYKRPTKLEPYTLVGDPAVSPSQNAIILVDDDPFYRAMFGVWAQLRKVPVRTYSSTEEVLQRAPLNQCLAMIVDYYLDHETGASLLEHIRQMKFDGPVFVISSDNRVEELASYFSARFLPKTIGQEAIISRVVQEINH